MIPTEQEKRKEKQALIHLVEQLVGKNLFFFIGNRDKRVGTRECYQFIEALTEASYAHGLRSPPVQLKIYPSIGHKGHGTPPEIFRAGSTWLANILTSQ